MIALLLFEDSIEPMSALELKGIIAATVLPMTEDYAVDTPALRTYLEWILDQGVHGVAINVDTGEGPHLTHEESRHVLENAVDVIGGRIPVIAGLGMKLVRVFLLWEDFQPTPESVSPVALNAYIRRTGSRIGASVGGISHSPREHSRPAEIEAGAVWTRLSERFLLREEPGETHEEPNDQ